MTVHRITMTGGQGHRNVEQLISQWGPVVHDSAMSGLHLDLSRMTFVAPSAIVIMRSALAHARAEGRLGSITCDPPTGDHCKYLDRMDALRGFIELPESSGRREPEGFAPAADFVDKDDVGKVARELARSAGFKLPEAIRDTLLDVALELGANTVDHARVASGGGVVAAQRWKTQGMTEIAIADTGCGVLDSLRRNAAYSACADRDLLHSVCSNGVSSTGRSARGKGLLIVSQYVEEHRGSLTIYTHEWCHDRRASGTPTTSNLDARWEGTIVIWRIPTVDRIAAGVLRTR